MSAAATRETQRASVRLSNCSQARRTPPIRCCAYIFPVVINVPIDVSEHAR